MLFKNQLDFFFLTRRFRDWIEDQRSKHAENGKEAREKVLAAKSKVLNV